MEDFTRIDKEEAESADIRPMNDPGGASPVAIFIACHRMQFAIDIQRNQCFVDSGATEEA